MAYALTYLYGNNAYIVDGYTGEPVDVVVPDTYNDGTHGEHPVVKIEQDCFISCDTLTTIKLPKSLTSIASYAFYGCTNLKTITIPNSTLLIDEHAFEDCTSLTTMICCPTTLPTISADAISTATTKIIVPKESETAYKTASVWSTYASIIVGDNNYFNFLNYTQKIKDYIASQIGNAIGGNY